MQSRRDCRRAQGPVCDPPMLQQVVVRRSRLCVAIKAGRQSDLPKGSMTLAASSTGWLPLATHIRVPVRHWCGTHHSSAGFGDRAVSLVAADIKPAYPPESAWCTSS